MLPSAPWEGEEVAGRACTSIKGLAIAIIAIIVAFWMQSGCLTNSNWKGSCKKRFLSSRQRWAVVDLRIGPVAMHMKLL